MLRMVLCVCVSWPYPFRLSISGRNVISSMESVLLLALALAKKNNTHTVSHTEFPPPPHILGATHPSHIKNRIRINGVQVFSLNSQMRCVYGWMYAAHKDPLYREIDHTHTQPVCSSSASSIIIVSSRFKFEIFEHVWENELTRYFLACSLSLST